MLVIDQFEKAVDDYPNNIAIKTEDGRNIITEDGFTILIG